MPSKKPVEFGGEGPNSAVVIYTATDKESRCRLYARLPPHSAYARLLPSVSDVGSEQHGYGIQHSDIQKPIKIIPEIQHSNTLLLTR
jgi:hypothetical protein